MFSALNCFLSKLFRNAEKKNSRHDLKFCNPSQQSDETLHQNNNFIRPIYINIELYENVSSDK